MNDYISICEEAARVGGAILRDWEGRFKVREKGPADLVTEADLASQEAIRQIISCAFPDHAFVGEEDSSAARPENDFCWLVDPLDGTTNYVHGLPQYSVSVAVAERGEVLAGTIFDPVAQECFTAARGQGAQLNGQSIRTSDVTEMSEALVAVSFPPHVQRDTPEIENFIDVVQVCQAMRRMGSAALNLGYLAAGRLDAYWAHSIFPWDVAAGVLLVREAGGHLTSVTGETFDIWNPDFAAAAGPSLHGRLLEQLNRSDGRGQRERRP